MKTTLHKLTKWSAFPSLCLLVALYFINCAVTLGFNSSSFMSGFIINNTPIICLAVGMSMVIISGGIDISMGGLLSVVNVCFVTFTAMGFAPAAVIILCLLIAAAFGLLNGIVIGYLRVTPLIATFATSALLEGLALWILPNPGGSPDIEMAKFYRSGIGGIPIALFIVIALVIISLLIAKTRFGMWVKVSGSNETNAFVSGIPTGRTKCLVYVFAGVCAGLGGIAMTLGVNSGDATIGLSMPMICISACVIGGIDLAGGQGDVWGALFGIISLMFIDTMVLSLNVNSFYQDFVSGVVLLISLLGAVVLMNRSKRLKGLM